MNGTLKTRVIASLTILFCIAVDLVGALHGLLLT